MPGESIGALAPDLGDERRCQTIDRGRRPAFVVNVVGVCTSAWVINSSPNIGEAQLPARYLRQTFVGLRSQLDLSLPEGLYARIR
jgi:hypothetical protein